MVIPSFEDAEPSSLAAIEGGLLGPVSNGEVVFGLKKPSPVLFVAVESRRDGHDIKGILCLKASFDLF
jgi:hypothetical protein